MSDTIVEIRPRLKAGVFFAPSREGNGALAAGGAEIVAFQGATTYAWLERLAPYLTGRLTVAELTNSLPPTKRKMVEELVVALRQANLIRDAALDEPHSLSAAELETYAAEIAFVEAFCDSPERRFQRYRDARMVAVGAGAQPVAVAQAALLSGVRHVTVALTAQPTTELAQLRQQRAARTEVDRAQRLDWLTPGVGGELDATELQRVVAGADVVIHVPDLLVPERAVALDRLCARARTVSVQAVVAGDEAWIGPVCGPDRPTVRWESLWRRLNEHGGFDAVRQSGFCTGPVPGIIANLAVFACFEHLTGVSGADGPPRAVRLDLETLRTGTHVVPEHPAARVVTAESEAEFLDRMRQQADDGAANDGALAERVAGLSDEVLGVVRSVDEGHFEQFPVRVVRAVAPDPLGPRGGGDALLVVWGVGLDAVTAREQAIRLALGRYAALAVDRRRLLGEDGDPLRGTAPEWSGLRRDTAGAALSGAWLRGLSLADRTVRLVPATQVFADLAPEAGPCELPTGVGVAPAWGQAVEAGLLAHCRELTLAHLSSRDGPVPNVDLWQVELDEVGGRCRELLRVAGQAVAGFDITHLPGVPAFGFCLDDQVVAYAAGLTPAEAIRAGLERVLLAYQARAAGQLDDVPASVPAPPAGWSGVTGHQ